MRALYLSSSCGSQGPQMAAAAATTNNNNTEEDGDALMGLTLPDIPVSPETSSEHSDTFDSKTFMTPESPTKALQLSESVASRYSMSDVEVIIEASNRGEQGMDRRILAVILELVGEEKTPLDDRRLMLLCKQLSEYIVQHVYADHETSNDGMFVFPVCLSCPPLPLQPNIFDPDQCLEHLANELLPKQLAVLVAEFKHALAMTHLLVSLRGGGFLTDEAIVFMAQRQMVRASVWIATKMPQEVNRKEDHRRKRVRRST